MNIFNINRLVRKNILELKPYISFRDQKDFENPVLLDANESPLGEYNRYPDSTQKKLRSQIAVQKNLLPQQVAVGNGSDELIDLLIKIFCEPKTDSVLMMNPSFAMYAFYAAINDNAVLKIDLNDQFQLNKDEFLKLAKEKQPKIFFLCSPNNPTGNSIEDIEFFIQNFNSIVVVDEAYIEFSEEKSCVELLSRYPNLVILQTFSKAWGKAGARVGVAFASQEIISYINAVKAPYNVSSMSQEIISNSLNDTSLFNENLSYIFNGKAWLKNEFQSVGCIEKVFPSDANFFLIKFKNSETVYQALLENQIFTSNRAPAIPQCIRINVGTEDENLKLINVLKSI